MMPQMVRRLTEGGQHNAWTATGGRPATLALPAPQQELLIKAAFNVDAGKAKPDAEVITPLRIQMEHVADLAWAGRGQGEHPKIRATALAKQNCRRPNSSNDDSNRKRANLPHPSHKC